MYAFLKRALDVALSLMALLAFAAPLLALALWVKLDSPGPALFRQRRVGRGKRLFTLYKFRTMRLDAPGEIPTHLLADPMRHITRVGTLLRRTSLDELPQLYNILRGDMSLVGPRPALWNQDDLVRERDRYGANDLPPGLTGWAQVNGRDELPIPVKARYDGEYAARRSLAFDARIVWMTARQAFGGRGVREGASPASPPMAGP